MAPNIKVVKQDCARIESNYKRALVDLDAAWRDLALVNPDDLRKRRRLELRADALTQTARELARRHELSVKALHKLQALERGK